MKKMFFRIMAIVAVLSVGVACNKETAIDNGPEKQDQVTPESGKKMTITVKLSDALTKVSFDPVFVDGNSNNKPQAMAHKWETGDKLRITNASNQVEIYDLTEGAGTNLGTFEGNLIENGPFSVEVIPEGEEFDTDYEQTQDRDGDTSHLRYVASADGIEDLSSFELSETSQIIAVIAKLPADVAVTVNSLEIVTSVDDFANTTTLKVNLAEQEDVDTDDFLKIYANAPASWSIPVGGAKMLLRFNSVNANHTVYTRYEEFTAGVAPEEGKFNYIRMDCSHIDQYAGKSDNGTSAHPYLIADKYQMNATHELMARNAITYFKLLDDIDMDGILWEGLNNDPDGGLYNKYINFDGNNKKISNVTVDVSKDYPSIFGVLQGCVKDLTIDHFSATGSAKKCGVFASYIGTGTDYNGDKLISNVHVTNSTITGATNYCGGFAAQLNRVGYSITNCSVEDTEVAGTSYTAGFIAYIQRQCAITDVSVKGTDVTSTGHSSSAAVPTDGFAGGIAAYVGAAVDFDRCTYEINTSTEKTATILGPTLTKGNTNSEKSRYVGGIAAYVANVAATFDDCHVKSVELGLASAPGTNNNRYVGGAFGYLGASAKVGNTTACSVEAITMNENVRNYASGFISYLDGGTIENSTASSAAAIGNASYSGAVAGFVGYCVGGTLYNNSTSVNVQGAGNLGGFVGWNETTATSFEKCSASGNVTASANNAGGFAGIVKIGSSFTECHSSGIVNGTGYLGGLIGYINSNDVKVTKCYSISTVTGTNNYVGGLVGVCQDTEISKSYYSGTVTGFSRVGGLLGISLKDNAVTIENCYTTGHVVGSNSEQRFGGIVGDLGKGGSVTNCWSDMTVSAGRVCGGIVGLACYQTWGDATVANNSITKCIAWNPSVEAAQKGDYGSSAAIVGHTSFKNILSSCYRRSDMVYSNSNDTLPECITEQVDQPDCNGTNWVGGTTPGTTSSSNQNPYYGVAKDVASNTVSSVAQTLGWSSDIWDFSGDYPTLK